MCTIQPLCLGAERPDHRAEAVGLVSVLRAHHSGRARRLQSCGERGSGDDSEDNHDPHDDETARTFPSALRAPAPPTSRKQKPSAAAGRSNPAKLLEGAAIGTSESRHRSGRASGTIAIGMI